MKKTLIIILFFLIPFLLFNNFQYPKEINKLETITLYDSNDEEFYAVTRNHERSYITDIPEIIKEAFVEIEDQRFYQHHGFDLIRIIKVFFTNQFEAKEGASTITQQLARMMFLSNEKNFKRKFNELIIALRLEQTYSKDEILECYLNNLYFGHNIYGIADAASFFFNKDCSELSINEIALLIAIIKGPAIYSPLIDYSKAMERKNLILKKLTDDTHPNIEIYGIKKNKFDSAALFYKDLVLSKITKSSLDIYTNYDSELGIEASKYDASICAIEPYTGKILLATSGNYYESDYNKAVLSKRQLGSTVKPFLYYEALNCGMNPLSTFKSEPTSFYINNDLYAPHNYNQKYENADITMAYALATSDNIYAVKTHLYLGMEKLYDVLRLFSIDAKKIPSLALGAVDTTLMSITNAYNCLASTGKYSEPYLIRKVYENGEIIHNHEDKSKRLLTYQATFVINHLLTLTFNEKISHKIKVTGNQIIPFLSRTYAGKSGSTDYDSYMIGFQKKITIGVWRGKDINSSDNGKTKIIWARLMEKYSPYEWYDDESMKKLKVNPTGFGNYYTDIYFNEYLPIYEKS